LADSQFETWLVLAFEANPNLIVIPKLWRQLDLSVAAKVAIPGIDPRPGIRGLCGKATPVVFEPFLQPPRLDTRRSGGGLGNLSRMHRLSSCFPRDWRGPAMHWATTVQEPARSTRYVPGRTVRFSAVWQNTPSVSLPRLAAADSFTCGNLVHLAASIGGSLKPRLPRLAVAVCDSEIPGAPGRLYRMRPRSAVAWPELRAFTLVEPGEVLAIQGHASMPAAALPELTPVLRTLSRPYHMRAGGPIGAARMAPWLSISATPESLLGFASVPPFPRGVVESLEPKYVDRLFRYRPRAGVGADVLLNSLEAACQLFKPEPSIPGARMADTAPDRAEPFKSRPRAGINDPRLPLFENRAPGTSEAAPNLRVIPLSACTVAEISAAPRLLTRAFRMRPRTGVADTTLTAFEALAPTATVSGPAPKMAFVPAPSAGCSPNVVDKLYRMRPRAGVTDPSVANHQLADGTPSTVILHPVISSLVFADSECVPSQLERFYRMRPRTGVDDPSLLALTATPSTTVPFAPALTFTEMHSRAVAATDGKVPPQVEKLFRARPRAAVDDTHAPLESIESRGSVAAAHSRPEAYPNGSFTATETALLLSDRLFRMRPRAGVNDPKAQLQGPDSQNAVAERESKPGAYPGSAFTQRLRAPLATDRLFRMRPRGGVRGSITATLNRPEPLDIAADRAYPATTAGVPMLTQQPIALLRRITAVDGGAEWLATAPAPMSVGTSPLRPSHGQPGCAPEMALELFPADPVNELESDLAPAFLGHYTSPVEDSEIFVMPPVPELHVVHEYNLPHSDRQTRIGPPTASAGTPDMDIDTAEPLDGAMVARSMLACSMVEGFDLFRQSMAIAPGIVHAPAWKRTWNSVRAAFLGRDFGLQPAAWLHAPVFRLATCGVGVLFTVILWSASYAPVSSATARVGTPAPAGTAMLTAFSTTVQRGISERSATDLREDFASGVHEWSGDGDWSSSWNYDDRGGVKPGALAILKTSRGLTDYTVEFLGQIEKKALGFTVRSADTQNYQAVKLVVKRPGPLPVVSIVHYAVVDGKESARQETRLPIQVFDNTIYRIRLSVRDDTFTLAVNDQVVDAWVDNRIAKGGVGFFAGAGESARVYDMRVYHQADALGKALAYIAKKEPQGEKGISQE